MDCCNYVQPYPAHGHFYHQQQQHNFCYDNTNVYGAYGIGGGVGGAQLSDGIEANASRYNRMPPGYPTDYVYNPKEARLRKAMREQSRELSRQTILQTAIASATGNTSVGGPGCGGNGVIGNGSPLSGTGGTNFLNHPLNCPPSVVAGTSIASAAVTSLPGSPSFNSGNRIINPWFSGAHGPASNHLKPILSPRVMTVAQHQQQHQQQQQHRTFDKTKEVLRKQAECAAASGPFSAASNSPYSTDFSTHGNTGNLSGQGHQSSSHDTNDYGVIAEFPDGQKWHPYQNGPSPYHARGGGPLTKMGALHPGMQPTNPHTHGGWNPFCAVPLSTVNRASRHMVFLQEQQQNQHCGFPEEMQIPYMQNKHMEISHRLHPSYLQQEHQAKLQSSVMSSLNMSQLQEPEKSIEDGPRWESNGGTSANEGSLNALGLTRRETDIKLPQDQNHDQLRLQCSRQHQQSQNREQHQQQQQQQHQQQQQQHQRYNDSSSPTEIKHQKMSHRKQPLPGFHQAFGSTEIGRFSRSEFFANMVGESNNLIPEGFISSSMFPFSPNSQIGICSGNPMNLPTEENICEHGLSDNCYWIAPFPPGHPAVSNLNDPSSSYAAFLDYSHRLNQQDWLHKNNAISQDFQTAMIEQPGGGFSIHENDYSLLATAPEHYDRPGYSESNYSNSSPGSGSRDLENRQKIIPRSYEDEPNEPENLSSRSISSYSAMEEESTSSETPNIEKVQFPQ